VIGTLFVGFITNNSNNKLLMATWIFVVASKHFDFDKILKSVYYSQLLAFIFVLYMFFSGYIEENSFYRGSLIRHSLGFTHPNQLGVTVFLLGVYRIYFRKKRIGIWDMAILSMLFFFVREVPNSKSSYYALFILIIIVGIHILVGRSNADFSVFSNILILIAAFSNIFSVFMSLNKIPFLKPIDRIMSLRFSMCYKTYNYYGIKLFGQDVQLFIKKEALGKYYHFWLDNAYMALLLRYGVILYIVFSAIYISAMIIQKKKKNYLLLEIMCLFAIYGIMENNFFSISQNLFLLILGDTLFQNVSIGSSRNGVYDTAINESTCTNEV
jgi:hypothetical protein